MFLPTDKVVPPVHQYQSKVLKGGHSHEAKWVIRLLNPPSFIHHIDIMNSSEKAWERVVMQKLGFRLYYFNLQKIEEIKSTS